MDTSTWIYSAFMKDEIILDREEKEAFEEALLDPNNKFFRRKNGSLIGTNFQSLITVFERNANIWLKKSSNNNPHAICKHGARLGYDENFTNWSCGHENPDTCFNGISIEESQKNINNFLIMADEKARLQSPSQNSLSSGKVEKTQTEEEKKFIQESGINRDWLITRIDEHFSGKYLRPEAGGIVEFLNKWRPPRILAQDWNEVANYYKTKLAEKKGENEDSNSEQYG